MRIKRVTEMIDNPTIANNTEITTNKDYTDFEQYIYNLVFKYKRKLSNDEIKEILNNLLNIMVLF